MQWYKARFLYSVDVRFERYRPRDLLRHYERWVRDHACMGLGSSVVRHADCGGVTSAAHYVCFGNIFNKPTIYVPCVPRILSHIINPAEKTIWRSQVEAPLPLVGPLPSEAIITGGLLRLDGLLDVRSPTREIL